MCSSVGSSVGEKGDGGTYSGSSSVEAEDAVAGSGVAEYVAGVGEGSDEIAASEASAYAECA